MNFFFRFYEGLLKAMGVFSSLIIASIALLLTTDVFLRNKGLGNMPWLLEVTEYGLFASTFIAAPWVLHMGGHVKVDIFLKIFPEAISNIIQKYINIFGFIICSILFIFSLRATFDAWSIESLIIKELILKEWLLLSLIPFTTFILSLEFIFQFFKKNLKDNNDAINNSIDGF